MSDELAHFVYVIGPTASGKTDLSLQVAEKLQWPILNCDSVQVYKEVNIGTAKPSVEERSQVPHYLFDYVEPPAKLSAADYLRDVTQCLNENKINQALFVGGSGFYIQALQKGLYPETTAPSDIKNNIQMWIDDRGMGSLYEWVKENDPIFAEKISENDHYRVRRAVEVMLSQKKTLTELKNQMAEENHSVLPPHKSLKVGLRDDKEILRQRVELRTRRMLANGLVAEVEALVARGLKNWAPLASVGYKEVQAYLAGQLNLNDLEARIVTSTMQLIKKQMTWFKRDPQIQWFSIEEQDKALAYVESKVQASR